MSEPGSTTRDKSAGATTPWGRALDAIRRLSKPLKILIATTLIALVGFGLWFGVRAANEPYAVLYSHLGEEDAAQVVAKLKEQKVPHRVVEGGQIEVPEARVHELRLEMAGAGLPRGGGVGFESFDKMRLGATEFEQKVLFRRALEGELMRTISSVSAVESARVHLVLPERSVFATRREPGSASVVLKLRPGRELGNQEIGAIVHLVASAVPGLTADQVALTTTEGRLLKRPKPVGEDASVGGNNGEEASAEVRALERSLEERARAMLERVVGEGHVDVRVSAEMDFSRVERTEDHFKPQQPILRSEELTREKVATADGTPVAGVPGAESNLPTGSEESVDGAETTPQAQSGIIRHQHTRNFELDRVTEKKTSNMGTIKRLTVAVVVDGIKDLDENGETIVRPYDDEEVERLTALVKSAVGADDKRSDVVTVQSMTFFTPEAAVDEAANENVSAVPPVKEMTPIERYKKLAPFAAIPALATVLLIAALLVRRRRKRIREIAAVIEEPKPVIELPPVEEPAQLIDPREEALRRATDDPATAALVIRYWLGNAEAETSSNAA